jgi:hypothetical protein
MKPLKALLLLCTITIVAVTVLTAIETAYAFDIPAGCWQTEHTQNCRRCGFLWLKQQNREYWAWSCPNGGGGNHTSLGDCSGCSW